MQILVLKSKGFYLYAFLKQARICLKVEEDVIPNWTSFKLGDGTIPIFGFVELFVGIGYYSLTINNEGTSRVIRIYMFLKQQS